MPPAQSRLTSPAGSLLEGRRRTRVAYGPQAMGTADQKVSVAKPEKFLLMNEISLRARDSPQKKPKVENSQRKSEPIHCDTAEIMPTNSSDRGEPNDSWLMSRKSWLFVGEPSAPAPETPCTLMA